MCRVARFTPRRAVSTALSEPCIERSIRTCARLRPNRSLRAERAVSLASARGSLRPLRFARALDCCAICAASLRFAPAHFRATAFNPVHGIHPRMRLARLGRDTSRRPAKPPRGVYRARAADCALAPLACAPPLARCRHMSFFAQRKRDRLHRLHVQHQASRHNCALMILCHYHISAFRREAWRGGVTAA